LLPKTVRSIARMRTRISTFFACVSRLLQQLANMGVKETLTTRISDQYHGFNYLFFSRVPAAAHGRSHSCCGWSKKDSLVYLGTVLKTNIKEKVNYSYCKVQS
jgi:hypothetical protein